MANRPVSRLGGRVTPSTSRETNTPKLKSMIVVPTELVMAGAPISAAYQLQNRRAISGASHISNNASRHHNESRQHNQSFRQNSSHSNESFRGGNNGHNVTMPSSHLSSMTSHNNDSFVGSSDDDDEEVSSVTSGSDESDLAQSPAADIIRATYTSPIFDVSNRTLSTNLDSIEPSSVEPCPVDGCPLNPKSRVSQKIKLRETNEKIIMGTNLLSFYCRFFYYVAYLWC